MELTIEKNNGDYPGTKYRLDIKSKQSLSKEDYQSLIGAFETISGILDPFIEKEARENKINK